MLQLLFLSEHLHRSLENSHLLSLSNYEATVKEVSEQTEDLKREIFSALSTIKDEQAQTRYLQAIVGGIHLLSNEIFQAYVSRIRKPGDQAIERFLKDVDIQFSQLINLLRYVAPGNFDDQRQAPLSDIIQLKENSATAFRKLFKLQRELDEHTAELIPLLQRLINESLMEGATYQRVQYLQNLINVLGRIGPLQGLDLNFLLHHRLIFNNFNHPDYILFCNGKLPQKYGHLPIEKQVSELRKYELALNQMLPQQHLSFFPTLPFAKDSLLIYLTSELHYLHPPPTEKPALPKLRLNLSAAQLGFIARVFQNMDTLPESSRLAIYRWLSEHVSTKGTDNNSAESMRQKGENASVDTAVWALDFLHKAISVTRSLGTR